MPKRNSQGEWELTDEDKKRTEKARKDPNRWKKFAPSFALDADEKDAAAKDKSAAAAPKS